MMVILLARVQSFNDRQKRSPHKKCSNFFVWDIHVAVKNRYIHRKYAVINHILCCIIDPNFAICQNINRLVADITFLRFGIHLPN